MNGKILSILIFANISNLLAALPAEIVEPPAELSEAVEGQPATITCQVYGAPHPTVTWEKDGQTINVQPDSNSPYEILKQGHLVIRSPQFADVGTYTCIASNRFGDTKASGRFDVKS